MDTTETPAALRNAAACYATRKARTTHPQGSFDAQQRWRPSLAEAHDCCDTVRQPTRRSPFSLMTHCRTVRHIAQLYDVAEAALRVAVRRQTPHDAQLPLIRATRYKVVRVEALHADDVRYGFFTTDAGTAVQYRISPSQDVAIRYASLFAPDESYAFGHTYREAAKPAHRGGFYVSTLPPDLLEDAFMAGTVWQRKPALGTYAILEVLVWGTCIPYDRKEAWTYLHPVREVARFTIDTY